MRILGLEINRGKSAELKQAEKAATIINEALENFVNHPDVQMWSGIAPGFGFYPNLPFNGEKSDGHIGPIYNLSPDYYALSTRSWYAYTTNDIARTIADKYLTWIVDTGLKAKANPNKFVLQSEGITIDSERFNDITEARFDVWSNSKRASFCGEKNLKQIAKDAFLNAKVGGDVLVVLRYENNAVNIQLIDGRRVGGGTIGISVGNGNKVSNGVEIDSRGKHIAYHVKDGLEYKRIPAYSSTGLRSAFLVKGSRWQLDFHRGMPTISVVLESLAKLDRYKEATVGNAEEVAKIVQQIVHLNYSDGSNPLDLLERFKTYNNPSTVPEDDLGEQIARKVSATSGKTVHNMPKGSEMKPVQPSTVLKDFEQFYTTNAHVVCAAIGIPPNVAFSLYTDSFSASRAATKDWDHTIDVERDDFTDQFYRNVYRFWLFTEIMQGKIDAPGYVKAFIEKNYMVTESYDNVRFTGPHFPHIDPLKEVEAERLKLGDKFANVPLTTVEQSCEALGTGDSDSNMDQAADELSIASGLGFDATNQQAPAPNTGQ